MANVLHGLILDAPPGELQDVIRDIDVLVGNDASKKEGLENALKSYNEEQFMIFDVDGKGCIISEYNRLDDGRYVQPALGKSFALDHSSGKVSDVQEFEAPVSELESQISAYVEDHLATDSSYLVIPTSGKETILIVSNRYNPKNYWSGRWRSTYTLENDHLTGTIHIDAHYYEDGNVRLTTEKPVEMQNVKKDEVGKAIESLESDFHEQVNMEFEGLNEGAFKSLRRQLPITRQRMDWSKVAQYRIGADLSR